MSLRRFLLPLSGLLIVMAGLAACGSAKQTVTALPVTPESATPSATVIPARSLTVCLGQEPASLFPVNNPSSSARAVLAAVYDGPIDTNSYGYQPVILKDLPSLKNGDAQLFQKSVYVGDEVVDASDTPVTLAVGMKVRPAGCRSDTCAVVYDGKGTILMDQMQAQADQSLQKAKQFEQAAARAQEAGQCLAEAEAEAAKARATFEHAQSRVSSARNSWEQARQDAAAAAAATSPSR